MKTMPSGDTASSSRNGLITCGASEMEIVYTYPSRCLQIRSGVNTS